MKSSKKITYSLLFIFFFLSIHLIQAQTVMDQLKSNSQTTAFAEALESAGLDEKLEESGPFTLFAPSNDAFNELSTIQQSNKNVLLNHIFTGMATERSLRAMSNVTCLSGQTIQINGNTNLSVDGNIFLESNLKAENGIIHIIDGVIE